VFDGPSTFLIVCSSDFFVSTVSVIYSFTEQACKSVCWCFSFLFYSRTCFIFMAQTFFAERGLFVYIVTNSGGSISRWNFISLQKSIHYS
jgi:hypothetical protein